MLLARRPGQSPRTLQEPFLPHHPASPSSFNPLLTKAKSVLIRQANSCFVSSYMIDWIVLDSGWDPGSATIWKLAWLLFQVSSTDGWKQAPSSSCTKIIKTISHLPNSLEMKAHHKSLNKTVLIIYLSKAWLFETKRKTQNKTSAQSQKTALSTSSCDSPCKRTEDESLLKDSLHPPPSKKH